MSEIITCGGLPYKRGKSGIVYKTAETASDIVCIVNRNQTGDEQPERGEKDPNPLKMWLNGLSETLKTW